MLARPMIGCHIWVAAVWKCEWLGADGELSVAKKAWDMH